MRHWHRRRDVQPTPVSDVVVEATRLLTGRARQAYPPERGAPAWAAVNLLAHATAPELRGVAGQRTADQGAGFAAALSYLAAALLSSAPSAGELLEVQRELLVPLELDLLGSAVPSPATLGQLTALLIDTIETHRAHRER